MSRLQVIVIRLPCLFQACILSFKHVDNLDVLCNVTFMEYRQVSDTLVFECKRLLMLCRIRLKRLDFLLQLFIDMLITLSQRAIGKDLNTHDYLLSYRIRVPLTDSAIACNISLRAGSSSCF